MTLFWRYFLSFFGGMVVVAILGAATVQGVAWYRHEALEELNPADLVDEVRAVAHAQGLPGLKRWVREMDRQYSALYIYILNEGDIRFDILGRELPIRMQDRLRSRRELPDFESKREKLWPPADTEGRYFSWWQSYSIGLPDGTVLMMRFLPFDESRWALLSRAPVALAFLMFALAVVVPLCWVLARRVSSPVRELRQAAHALACGDLSVRTPVGVSSRRDELGLLARDFDRMAARNQALLTSREQLLRNVAHELRSPLTRLRMSLELARSRDDRQALQLDRIERESERLDQLVGHTLLLARLDTLPPPRQRVDLAEIIEALVDDARFEATEYGARIEWSSPGPLHVIADPESLGSAIENVLRNALRHTDADLPVRVTLGMSSAGVTVEISDGGPGVPPEELTHLFEPFYRVAATSTNMPGAGLGLSIAQAAVVAHGGRIWASNLLPRGLRVSIWLPLPLP